MCEGPRLSWSMVGGTRVLARDRAAGRSLIGGLGVFGVGSMWWDDDEGTRLLPGFDDAPEVEKGVVPC